MKKTTIKLSVILFILCTFLHVNDIFAQEKTTSEMLQSSEWVMQLRSSQASSSELKITDTEFITSLVKGKEKLYEVKNTYYLSDEVTWTFDKQKVGRVLNGKYIIVNSVSKNPDGMREEQVKIHEILELTSTDLQLKNISNNIILKFRNK